MRKPTFAVTVPRSVLVRYPLRCVACGADQAPETLVVEDTSGAPAPAAPACSPCSVRHARWRRAQLWLPWIGGGGILGVVSLLTAESWREIELILPRFSALLIAAAFAVVFGVATSLSDRLAPPALSVRVVDRASVRFCFRDRAYAADFAATNGAALEPGDVSRPTP